MIRTVTLWVGRPVLRSIGHNTEYYYHNNDLSGIHLRYMHMAVAFACFKLKKIK